MLINHNYKIQLIIVQLSFLVQKATDSFLPIEDRPPKESVRTPRTSFLAHVKALKKAAVVAGGLNLSLGDPTITPADHKPRTVLTPPVTK